VPGEYAYDQNGNMIQDLNKGIGNIEYNYLNLPQKVMKSPTNYLTYVYDADFNLKVKVNSHGYELIKDTTASYHDSLKMFVTFRFEPYYRRYTHPDIYKYFEGETSRFKQIADSLYSIKALPNAEGYLNDTIPLASSIIVSIK